MNRIEQLRKKLSSGWNSWNNESVLSQVLLPFGLSINLGFKQSNWINEKILMNSLIGQKEHNSETIYPGYHAWDGSYSELTINWQGLEAKVQTAHHNNDIIIILTPIELPERSTNLIIETGFLWNLPGSLKKTGNTSILASYADKTTMINTTASHIEDPFLPCKTPFLSIPLTAEIGIYTGKKMKLEELKSITSGKREDFLKNHDNYCDHRETFLALQAGIAWNMIYDPRLKRVIATVGRLWNREYGGYCLFGWDNFFLAEMIAVDNKELAYSTILEHMTSITKEGFIPNDDRGNLSKSYDRSQPPIGSIIVWNTYKKYNEKWLLEEVFDDLMRWNSWWFSKRMNRGLLSFGSHKANNPFGETNVHDRVAAGYESGMDDSPMYEDVPFNPLTNILELQDVGLTSLVIADCKALLKMAKVLILESEIEILENRIKLLEKNLDSLWNDEKSIYLNHRTDINKHSTRISPTCFYPLLSQSASPEQAEQLINKHLLNPNEFYGEWMLPSISKNDSAFNKQRYWKGAIWPPLNYLVYLGLENYKFENEKKILAQKSEELFLKEWQRKNMICENYSSLTGTGDDSELSSDSFHAWGALLGLIGLKQNCDV